MLANFYGIMEVKHYHRGYLRLQSPALREEEAKEQLQTALKQVPGVKELAVNTRLGSSLILFDETQIEAPFLYLLVLKILGLEELALEQKTGRLTDMIRNMTESLDLSVYNKSVGLLDLKLVVSAIFVYYGLKKWRMFPGLPGGATLLWWAYNLMAKEK